jgi:hypothetical protein
MIVFLSLMLTMNLYNARAVLCFDDIYSVKDPIVLLRVDRVWKDAEKVNFKTIEDKRSWYKVERFHGLATIMALYVKNDSVPLPKNPVYLCHYGSARIFKEGYRLHTSGSHNRCFKGQVFLAPITVNNTFNLLRKRTYNISGAGFTWFQTVKFNFFRRRRPYL